MDPSTSLYTPSVMENNANSEAIAITRPRLYGIVQTYMQKQLPRDIHPAFKALRDREEAATTVSQISCAEGKYLPSLAEERDERSGDEQVGGSNEEQGYDEDDVPLYANSQG